jgi:hypothetical protein
MTHSELVERAARWLRKSRRCGVVLTNAGSIERPDAIGWHNGDPPVSILVECKVSRADFRHDKLKPFRDPAWNDTAIGRFRYYLTPKGLVKPTELPARWGLLEVVGRGIRQSVKARRWDLDAPGKTFGLQNELKIAIGELYKVQFFLQNGTGWQSKSIERRLLSLPSDYAERFDRSK